MSSKDVSLPHHIIFHEILTRISAHKLLQFKSVSKLWCESISDPSFIKLHLTRCTSQPPGQVRKTPSVGPTDFHTYYNSAGEAEYHFNLHSIFPENLLFVLLQTSYNGLLLFSTRKTSGEDDCLHCLYICNPVTRQITELPNPPDDIIAGILVFDKDKGKYKVFGSLASCTGFLVLTLDGSKSWRNLKLPEATKRVLIKKILLDQKIYWISFDGELFLIAVDITSEETREIRLPCPDFQIVLMELNGSLLLLHYPLEEHCYTIWRLDYVKEPCWTRVKKYTPLECPNRGINPFFCGCSYTGHDEIERQFKSALEDDHAVGIGTFYHYSSLVDVKSIQSGDQVMLRQPKFPVRNVLRR